MSLSPGGIPVAASAPPAAMDPRVPMILGMRRGAGWFLTIAILSGVNSVLQIFDAMIRFMIWQGYSAARELAHMQQVAQPGLSQPRLP